MCIYCGVLSNLIIPLIEIRTFSSSIPAVKNIACFCRSCFWRRCCLIFFNYLIICQMRRSIITINKAYCVSGSIPFSIKLEITGRHFFESIWCSLTFLVCEPTCKCVIVIDFTLIGSWSPNIRSLVNISIKFYIINSRYFFTTVEIVNLECVTVVEKIIRSNISKPICIIIRMIICISSNRFGRINSIRCCLTIQSRLSISIIICILQIIIYLNCIIIVSPVTCNRYTCASSRK